MTTANQSSKKEITCVHRHVISWSVDSL